MDKKSLKIFTANTKRRYEWDATTSELRCTRGQGGRNMATIGAQCRHRQQPTRLVVPTEEEMERLVLNAHARAHDGRDRLQVILGTQYKFRGMTALIERVLKDCARCQEFKDTLPRVKQAIITRRRFELVMFDLFDLPFETPDGFKHVLLVKDHFSKFHWGCALRTKGAEEVANFMVGLFQTVCIPETFHCDNGGEFINKAMDRAMEYLAGDDEKLKTTHGRPRNPQTQGLIERANSTVKTKVIKKAMFLSLRLTIADHLCS